MRVEGGIIVSSPHLVVKHFDYVQKKLAPENAAMGGYNAWQSSQVGSPCVKPHAETNQGRFKAGHFIFSAVSPLKSHCSGKHTEHINTMTEEGQYLMATENEKLLHVQSFSMPR